MITFACVRTGTKYGWESVERLRKMILRHCPVQHGFFCVTDSDLPIELSFDTLDLRTLINCEWATKWWPKVLLLAPGCRPDARVIYIDLDSVIVGDLTPLVEWSGDFAICSNFARAAGANWPCKYGSCVMSFAPGWGQSVFDEFMAHRESLMADAGKYGDQWVIEKLVPNATLLQDVMPKGFFLNKRDLHKYPDAPPPEAAIVVFGGNQRPDNCPVEWVRREWR